MAALGTGLTQNIVKIYSEAATVVKPTTDATFTDVTSYFIDYRIETKLCDLATFTGSVGGTLDDTRRAYFSSGCKLYVLVVCYDQAGDDLYTKLFYKFVLENPTISNERTIKITGTQSTGTQAIRKQLVFGMTNKLTFQNYVISDILNRTGDSDPNNDSPIGILKDDSNNVILAIDGTDNGGSQYYSFEFDKENRIAALKKITTAALKEWYIDHGTNKANPYDEGDTLHVKDRVGDAASQKTFNLSGASQNAKRVSNTYSKDGFYNHVIIKGVDMRGQKIETEAYDATLSETYIKPNYALDTYLTEDLTATAGYFHVLQSPQWSGLSNFVVRIDSETILVLSYDVGTGTATVALNGRGIDGSKPAVHKKGADVVTFYDAATIDEYGAIVTSTWPKMWVACNTIASGATYIRVGSERMACAATGTLGGIPYIQVGRFCSTNPYAHWDCAPVYNGDYCTSTPSTSDANSIYCCGLSSTKLSEWSPATKHSLDMKAEQYLTTHTKPSSIVISPINPYEVLALTGLEMGDTITVHDAETAGVIADSTYRIIRMTLTKARGPLTLEIECNDISIRNYSIGGGIVNQILSIASNVAEQTGRNRIVDKISSETNTSVSIGGAKQIQLESPHFIPRNNIDTSRTCISADACNGFIINLCNPTCLQDAATKWYVDNCGGGGSTFWCDGTDPYIYPKNSCSICVPNVYATTNLKVDGNIYVNNAGSDDDAFIYFYDNGSPTQVYLKWCDACSDFSFASGVCSSYFGALNNMYINVAGPDGDSSLYFWNCSSETGAYLSFCDTENKFLLSNDVIIFGTACPTTGILTPIVCATSCVKSSGLVCAGASIYTSCELYAECDISSGGNMYINYNGGDCNSYLYFYYGCASGSYMKFCTVDGYFTFYNSVFSCPMPVACLFTKCCFRLPVGTNLY